METTPLESSSTPSESSSTPSESSTTPSTTVPKKKKQGLGWIEWIRGWMYIIYEMLFQRIMASHLQNPLSLPPINNLTCIVTGSTSGIGLQIARQLAESGAHVVMAVRNTKAAHDLIHKWQSEWTGLGLPLNIEVMELDLLSLESVSRFAEAWNARMGPLHVLINNAGIFSIRGYRGFPSITGNWYSLVTDTKSCLLYKWPVSCKWRSHDQTVEGSAEMKVRITQRKGNKGEVAFFSQGHGYWWTGSIALPNVKSTDEHLRPQKFSKDGHEEHMQVNHLAPALLSILLLPSLIRGSPSRIINVNSVTYAITSEKRKLFNMTMHYVGFVDTEDMNVVSGKRKYTSLVGYTGSKLAQVMFSSVLHRRLPAESGISVLCVSPGVVQTNVARDLPKIVQAGYHLIPYFIFNAQEGSRSALFSATDPQIPEYCELLKSDDWPVCAFISQDCRPTNPSEEAHNIDTAYKVWEKTLEMIGLPSDAIEKLIEGEEVRCRYGERQE
ncbi:hypothetical protein SADUNF_Sadunf15G0024900 [Salix dunnii]|uniref:Uncharacterized protein n=1 Tax=Salix dunnii TaxID=1413687 RepID=A0A835JDK2_9ROSI|nr:hypothetical protein SADUNF_Sadunf15G0024900 [Salix dunnii]